MRDLLDALQAFQRERVANYAASDKATPTASRFRTLGISPREPAAFDPLVPLEKVPTSAFLRWLATPEAAEFAAATSNFGDKPLSLTKISNMLAEVDVFSLPFETTRDGHRHQMRVWDLADLERVWGERRS